MQTYRYNLGNKTATERFGRHFKDEGFQKALKAFEGRIHNGSYPTGMLQQKRDVRSVVTETPIEEASHVVVGLNVHADGNVVAEIMPLATPAGQLFQQAIKEGAAALKFAVIAKSDILNEVLTSDVIEIVTLDYGPKE